MVYNRSNSNYIVTTVEWKLNSHVMERLKSFSTLKQQCSRNNALLLSVFPYAEVLIFSSFKASSLPGQSGSATLEEQAFERWFYNKNNS